jgi:hypothetical protein
VNKPDLRDVFTEDEISAITNALGCASWHHPAYRQTHTWFVNKAYPDQPITPSHQDGETVPSDATGS